MSNHNSYRWQNLIEDLESFGIRVRSTLDIDPNLIIIDEGWRGKTLGEIQKIAANKAQIVFFIERDSSITIKPDPHSLKGFENLEYFELYPQPKPSAFNFLVRVYLNGAREIKRFSLREPQCGQVINIEDNGKQTLFIINKVMINNTNEILVNAYKYISPLEKSPFDLSDTELNQFLLDIDDQMKDNDVPIHGREVEAYKYLAQKLDINVIPFNQGILGEKHDSLMLRVASWFQYKYDFLLRTDLFLGEVAFLMQKDIWVISIPYTKWLRRECRKGGAEIGESSESL